jgi:hypothetical protein
MFLLDHLLNFLLLCALWLCELMGWKQPHQWLSKLVKEPDLSAEKHVL